MKKISISETRKITNSESCQGMEYEFGDKDIDCATFYINGSYPGSGFSVNKECKAMVYVLEGQGTLCLENKEIEYKEGDALLIGKGEKYRFNADCKILMSCTPAWNIEQYVIVED